MDKRLALHEELVGLLGSRDVYYQPPPSVKMKYPCIVYNRDGSDVLNANNDVYRHKKRYQITYIDRTSNELVTDSLERMLYCRFDNKMVIDNLYHTYLTLYY